MRPIQKIWALLAIGQLLFAGCSETKSLQPGQYLFKGANIVIQKSDSIGRREKSEIKDELEDLVRPVPNTSVLGIKYKLLVYNFADSPKGKGLSYWLKNKVGEPPVLASMSALE